MNDIKLLVGKGSKFFDGTMLVQKAVLSGRRGDAPRTISVTLDDSEQHSRLKVNCGQGQAVYFYLGGKEVFRGLLMTDGRGNSRSLL